MTRYTKKYLEKKKMTFEEKQKEIEAGWDKQSAEKKEEETNKYLEDMEWGHRMGF